MSSRPRRTKQPDDLAGLDLDLLSGLDEAERAAAIELLRDRLPSMLEHAGDVLVCLQLLVEAGYPKLMRERRRNTGPGGSFPGLALGEEVALFVRNAMTYGWSERTAKIRGRKYVAEKSGASYDTVKQQHFQFEKSGRQPRRIRPPLRRD